MTVYNITPCEECCDSVCCEMVLECEITSDCDQFFDGTWGFYADPGPILGGTGPGWELDPDARGNFATMTINCNEDDSYTVFAQVRRNEPGPPATYDEKSQIFRLADCADDVDWTVTFTLSGDNYFCPGGTVVFHITKA